MSSKGAKRTKSSDKGSKRAKKDKNAPKRAMSAYILYSNAHRNDVNKENPGIKFGDVAKIISAKWKDASDSEKKKFESMSAKDKDRYEREMSAYKKNGGGSSSTSSKKSSSSSSSSKKSSKKAESSDSGSDSGSGSGSD